MGIVSSTLFTLAARIAWNFQLYLDPSFRSVDVPKKSEQQVSSCHQSVSCNQSDEIDTGTSTASHHVTNRIPEICNSTHQENRNRRAAQLRYRRKRPSSFDAALIVRSMNKNGISSASTSSRVVSSTPSTLKRQQAPVWNDSSSSTSTSSSSSSLSSSEDSDMELPKKTEKNLERSLTQPERNLDENDKDMMSGGEEYTMSAAEEAAFRMTLGRGHFSRSNKDKFLNNLRLEKRLNDLNREFFELTCRAHSQSLHQRNSGDLRKIV